MSDSNPDDNVQYIGHGLKVEVGYGDAPSTTPASIRQGEQIKRSPTAKKIMAGMGADVASAVNSQMRTVSDKGYAPSWGTKGASAGGTVPPIADRSKQSAALLSLMNRKR
jgi:hypothetical protein